MFRLQQLLISPLARLRHLKIKLYIDVLEIGDLLVLLLSLPLAMVNVIKEEWFWWVKLYPFEISYPINWEKERTKALAESWRRAKKHQGRVR